MGPSLLDCILTVYKNSPRQEFWEPHLDYIVYLHVRKVGANYHLPLTSIIKKQDVYNWPFGKKKKKRKLTKNNPGSSSSRVQTENKKKRERHSY